MTVRYRGMEKKPLCLMMMLSFLPVGIMPEIGAQGTQHPFPWIFTQLAELDTGLPEAEVGEIAGRLMDLRNAFAPVQRFWWIGQEGFLLDRVPVDARSQSWRDGPGRYAALFPDGTLSEEVDGPGGLVTVANGYAVALRSDPDDLPALILYRIERR